jgi:hypothetical protein
VKKLGSAEQLRMCYEARPTGYVEDARDPMVLGAAILVIDNSGFRPHRLMPCEPQQSKPVGLRSLMRTFK